MSSRYQLVIRELTLEFILLTIACLIVANLGILTYFSTEYNECFFKLGIIGLPVVGLLIFYSSEKFRRYTLWIPAFLYLIDPLIGVLICLLRLSARNSLSKLISKVFCSCFLVAELAFFPFVLMFFCFGPGHTQTEQIKVGRIFVNQYIEEYSLRSNPRLVIEKQIPLLRHVYLTSVFDDIDSQWNLLNIKVIDDKVIEYPKDGKLVRIKVY